MADKTCSNCEHFYETNGVRANYPHCRRYPPIHIGPERKNIGYPRTWPEEHHCGEYKKRKP